MILKINLGVSVDIENLGLARQLPTSKFELSRARTEVSHMRSSVARNQPTETPDAEDLLKKLRGENFSWLVTIYSNRPRLTDLLTSGAVKRETARYRSLWEDAQNAMNSWSHAEGPTGVGSRDPTLLIGHTPLEIHLSLLYKVSTSRAQFLLQL